MSRLLALTHESATMHDSAMDLPILPVLTEIRKTEGTRDSGSSAHCKHQVCVPCPALGVRTRQDELPGAGRRGLTLHREGQPAFPRHGAAHADGEAAEAATCR